MIIAIDGPSGAGKSTLGKMLAKKLGLLYLDTGAMYRAVALAVLRKRIGFDESEVIVEIAETTNIDLDRRTGLSEGFARRRRRFRRDTHARGRTGRFRGFDDFRCPTHYGRSPAPDRRIGPNGCVLEGRDIGSVVFPNADFKFFLTAKPEARARRRFNEDTAKGLTSTYEQTLAEINERDQRDVSREDSPLTIAEDAVVIDTSELDLTEVFEQMLGKIREQNISCRLKFDLFLTNR